MMVRNHSKAGPQGVGCYNWTRSGFSLAIKEDISGSIEIGPDLTEFHMGVKPKLVEPGMARVSKSTGSQPGRLQIDDGPTCKFEII